MERRERVEGREREAKRDRERGGWVEGDREKRDKKRVPGERDREDQRKRRIDNTFTNRYTGTANHLN